MDCELSNKPIIGEFFIKNNLMKTIILIIILISLSFSNKVFGQEFNAPPNKIIIPKVSINLPVFTAQINYDTWEVRMDGASFGQSTTYPGNIGNTVIFSHARPGLFQDLPNLQIGDYIHVFTAQDWFVYKVAKVLVVDPNDTGEIFSSNKHELTLFTCTGINYSKRFVVKAILVSDPQNSL